MSGQALGMRRSSHTDAEVYGLEGCVGVDRLVQGRKELEWQ